MRGVPHARAAREGHQSTGAVRSGRPSNPMASRRHATAGPTSREAARPRSFRSPGSPAVLCRTFPALRRRFLGQRQTTRS